MAEYHIPEFPDGFDEPPTYSGPAWPRPGGTPIGTGTGSSSWGPAQAAVTQPQGGGSPLQGGGPNLGDSSWLPTSMLKRGL